MYPTTLKPLLANPVFAPGDLGTAESLCDQWFRSSAALEAFTLRAIFRQLLADDWDKQAVPAADWQRFTADVLPRMVAVLDALPGDTGAQLRAVVIGYHSTI